MRRLQQLTFARPALFLAQFLCRVHTIQSSDCIGSLFVSLPPLPSEVFLNRKCLCNIVKPFQEHYAQQCRYPIDPTWTVLGRRRNSRIQPIVVDFPASTAVRTSCRIRFTTEERTGVAASSIHISSHHRISIYEVR
jgi:hypothetical protein